jgi:hypothetical protein
MSDPSQGHPRGTEPAPHHEDEAPDVSHEGPEGAEAESEGAWQPLGTDDSSTAADEAPMTMIPARARRQTAFERVSMRVLATGGIVGLATAMGAIMVSQDAAGWVVGLVVGLTSVVLAAILWSSRQL